MEDRVDTPPIESTIRTRVLVREVMNSPVVIASPTDTIKIIAEKMAKFKIGSVIIIDKGNPLGIVTESDIVSQAVAKNKKPSELKAEDIMSKPLHTIDSERDVTEAARTMRKLNIKRLGVTYKDKLSGIVTVSDLVAVTPDLIELISEKARILTGETQRQRGYVVGYCDLCNQWSDLLQETDGKFICEECRSGT